MASNAFATVSIPACYQFNETGDITGTAEFTIAPGSIILVEGVYASALEKDDWDLRIYILTDHDRAKKRQ